MMFGAKPPVVVPQISTEGRVVSVIAGLILAAAAVKPRPNRILSVVALATGSYLAYRGATGHCPLTEAVHDHCHRSDSRGR
ncbi:YgaP-like transmembrane domain [Kaistia granuli]|jgi:uncharacterized membrane protein|uniref:YgaP-like transmembrane domain n=1 Tax=Kaistia granuli TaxID=363259 RepID=UPI00037E1644|nr:YgaP-like transmembrane domain [Kaistia granuli]